MLPLKVCFEMQTVTMFSGSIFAGQSLKQTWRLLQTLMEDQGAPSASDASIAWRAPLLHATDRVRYVELSNAVSTTEIMIADFCKKGHLTQQLGQILLDTLKYLPFDAEDIGSETIVHLLRRFKRPFAETAMHTYNFWKEGEWKSAVGYCCARILGGVSGNNAESRMEAPIRLDVSAHFRCSWQAFDRTPVLWLVVGADTQ